MARAAAHAPGKGAGELFGTARQADQCQGCHQGFLRGRASQLKLDRATRSSIAAFPLSCPRNVILSASQGSDSCTTVNSSLPTAPPNDSRDEPEGSTVHRSEE